MDQCEPHSGFSQAVLKPNEPSDSMVTLQRGRGPRLHPVPLSLKLLHLDITSVARTAVTFHSLS